MNAVDGFWVVQFAGMEGKGGGVAVLVNGRVFGGDSAYTYLGTYDQSGQGLESTILVENFDPKIGNVLGMSGDFSLTLKMQFRSEDVLVGQGTTPLEPGFGIKIRLTRRSKLP